MITMQEILYYFSFKYQNNWENVFLALKRKEKILEEDLKNFLSTHYDQFLTILDHSYPEKLKLLDKPPFLIYFKGNLKLLDNRLIMIKTDNIYFNLYSFFILKLQLDLNKVTLLCLEKSWETEKILRTSIYKNIILIKNSGINKFVKGNKELEEKLIKDNGLILSLYPDYADNKKVEPKVNEEFAYNLLDAIFYLIDNPRKIKNIKK